MSKRKLLPMPDAPLDAPKRSTMTVRVAGQRIRLDFAVTAADVTDEPEPDRAPVLEIPAASPARPRKQPNRKRSAIDRVLLP